MGGNRVTRLLRGGHRVVAYDRAASAVSAAAAGGAEGVGTLRDMVAGAGTARSSLRRRRPSGGIWGLETGYCLMVGGEPDAVRRLTPVFETLAPEAGSRRENSSTDRLLAAMRHAFGGHAVRR